MTTTFEEFSEEVQENLGKVWDEVQEQLGRMADVLNSAADKFDWTDVVFAVPKLIIDGLTSDEVERAISKFNDEIRPQIEEKVREVSEDMGRVVSEMAGNPLRLKELSFDYADCEAALLYRAPSIESEIQQLGKHWSGIAYDSYSAMAVEQVQAMKDVAAAMEKASSMTNLAAGKILQLWVDLNDEIVRGLTAVIRLLGEATSVEKILSFEVPIVIKAIAEILDFAQAVAKVLEDYMIGVGFTDQIAWEQMHNGEVGLPENSWPVVHPGQVDDVVTPGSWTPV